MEASKMKRAAAHLEQEGLQEMEMALMGTPVKQLVDLMEARVHKAEKLTPPSSGAPSPSMERCWVPTPSQQAPKRTHHSPSNTTLVTSKEDNPTLQVAPLPSGPLRP